jgi:hypothetical protein
MQCAMLVLSRGTDGLGAIGPQLKGGAGYGVDESADRRSLVL